MASRALPALLVVLPIVAAAQSAPAPRQLTAEDYARAERFLPAGTSPLVSGTAGRPTFLDGGRFWYRATRTGGAEYVLVDAVRRRKRPAFPHGRLAAALGRAAAVGTLEAGKFCDLAIWDVESPAELVYRMGFNPLHSRVWKGR